MLYLTFLYSISRRWTPIESVFGNSFWFSDSVSNRARDLDCSIISKFSERLVKRGMFGHIIMNQTEAKICDYFWNWFMAYHVSHQQNIPEDIRNLVLLLISRRALALDVACLGSTKIVLALLTLLRCAALLCSAEVMKFICHVFVRLAEETCVIRNVEVFVKISSVVNTNLFGKSKQFSFISIFTQRSP